MNTEVFTCAGPYSLAYITHWLNSLAGAQWTSGTVLRVVDWHIIPAGSDVYSAVARVEVSV